MLYIFNASTMYIICIKNMSINSIILSILNNKKKSIINAEINSVNIKRNCKDSVHVEIFIGVHFT